MHLFTNLIINRDILGLCTVGGKEYEVDFILHYILILFYQSDDVFTKASKNKGIEKSLVTPKHQLSIHLLYLMEKNDS